jgi:hypothetical protein
VKGRDWSARLALGGVALAAAAAFVPWNPDDDDQREVQLGPDGKPVRVKKKGKGTNQVPVYLIRLADTARAAGQPR